MKNKSKRKENKEKLSSLFAILTITNKILTGCDTGAE